MFKIHRLWKRGVYYFAPQSLFAFAEMFTIFKRIVENYLLIFWKFLQKKSLVEIFIFYNKWKLLLPLLNNKFTLFKFN